MDLSGFRLIPAPLAVVRAGLQDPETLKACVPGCERLEQTSNGTFAGTVATKVGPIRAALAGTIVAAEAAEGWTLEAEGADPAAGSGKGRGSVRLEPAEGGTALAYEGSIEVEGKIGQLGSRLLSGVARQSIEAFLTNFSERAADGRLPGATDAAVPATDAIADAAAEPEPPLADAPPLVHEEPATEPAPADLAPPPLVEEPARVPLDPTPIAPTSVPDVLDPVEIAAANAVENPKDASGSVGRIMLVAAIVVVVAVAVYFGFLHRPPA